MEFKEFKWDSQESELYGEAYSEEEASKCIPGVKHFDSHSEIMKRNAEFLIESSTKISSYSPRVLSKMKKLYENEKYEDVIDTAYRIDKNRRERQDTPKSRFSQFLQNLLSLLK